MAITVNTKRDWELDDIHYIDKTADVAAIVEGAFLSQTAAEAVVHDLEVADPFVGVAARAAAANSTALRVIDEGTIRGAAVTGATTTTAPGATVYATDNDVLTLTASGALAVGRVIRGTGTGTADIFIQGAQRRSI